MIWQLCGTYFYPQRPKWTDFWRGRPSAEPCTSPRPPERADQTVSPPDLWPCQSWSYDAAEEQTNVATHPVLISSCADRWSHMGFEFCCIYGSLYIENTLWIRVQSVWNNMCTLWMKYFFLQKDANTEIRTDKEETAFELIFLAFMLAYVLHVDRPRW